MSEPNIPIGDVIYIAVKPILKIYLIIFSGWALVKGNILSMETCRGISNMAVNLLIPSLIFNKVVTNLSGSNIKDIGVVLLTSLLISCVGGAIAFVLGRVTPVPKQWYWGLIFGGIFGNIADLPIAYIQTMATGIVFDAPAVDRGATLSCVFLAMQSFLMMNVGMFQMVGLDFREKKKDEENNSSDDSTELKNVISPSIISNNQPDDSSKVHHIDSHVTADDEYITSDDEEMERLRELDNRLQVESYRGKEDSASKASLSRIFSYESQYSSRSKRSAPNNTQTIINEYSEAEILRHQTIDQLAKTISKTQFVGIEPLDEEELDQFKHSKFDAFINKYHLGWLWYMLQNFKRPPSIALFFSFFVSMIPWVRALFVHNSIHIKEAPDNLPVLNFLMDFTAYLGNAAVPMGVLLLGTIIARLKVEKLPEGFWKTSVLMVLCRLCVMPIIGVLWVNKAYEDGWIDDDVSRFVLIMTWGVPSATAQVYFTALYTPLEGDHLQMDCLAIFLLMQYPVLIVTLPILVTYILKVNLGM